MGASGDDIAIVLHPDAATSIGELQAWNVDTASLVWRTPFKSHNWGPVLATGGDLVFMGGTNDRYFRAFDARDGRILWQQRTNSGVIGVPVTYQLADAQYVAVLSGYGVDAEREQAAINSQRGTRHVVPQGGVLWVFGLP